MGVTVLSRMLTIWGLQLRSVAWMISHSCTVSISDTALDIKKQSLGYFPLASALSCTSPPPYSIMIHCEESLHEHSFKQLFTLTLSTNHLSFQLLMQFPKGVLASESDLAIINETNKETRESPHSVVQQQVTWKPWSLLQVDFREGSGCSQEHYEGSPWL